MREGSIVETTGDLGDNGLRNIDSRSPEALPLTFRTPLNDI
jgi:hypothetical protein